MIGSSKSSFEMRQTTLPAGSTSRASCDRVQVMKVLPFSSRITWNGQPRKVVMVANRNSFFYVLDRATGALLLGKPFTDTTWAREIGPDGKPIVLNDGSKGCLPDYWGGTNFMPPSFDPALGLFFVTARETCATFIPQRPEIAQRFGIDVIGLGENIRGKFHHIRLQIQSAVCNSGQARRGARGHISAALRCAALP